MAKLRIADGEAIVQLLMELDKAHGEVMSYLASLAIFEKTSASGEAETK